ncbi:MAG: nucleoside deaminase [Bacilli bacterium]|nr:nucleoside deaminase [Bacilli bacterium]
MNDALLEVAALEASLGVKGKDGGPFGAVITDKNGNIICKAHNMVLSTQDVTAHAEIMAIREACRILDTHDLSDYVLYSSCEPCPMCIGAMIMAHIGKVYYGATREDAKERGFKDDSAYRYFQGETSILETEEVSKASCREVLENYDGEVY